MLRRHPLKSIHRPDRRRGLTVRGSLRMTLSGGYSSSSLVCINIISLPVSSVKRSSVFSRYFRLVSGTVLPILRYVRITGNRGFSPGTNDPFPYSCSAISSTVFSVFSQPRHGSVMDFPYTPSSGFWQPSSR